MKIAVSGKGGVGKTTLTSLLSLSFQRAGYSVLAIDADPDANLAATLGFPNPEDIVPIVKLKELIAERTGTQPGSMGMYFKLNPRVDDIPARFNVEHKGIRLLVMGKIKPAGTGCYCPEGAFIRELIGHLLLDEQDMVIMDMEAGIEHLGRGTSKDVDAFLIVVEPGLRSLETAKNIADLASDLSIKNIYIVANRVTHDKDREQIERFFPGKTIIGMLPFSEEISQSGKEYDGVRIEDMQMINTIREKLIKDVSHG